MIIEDKLLSLTFAFAIEAHRRFPSDVPRKTPSNGTSSVAVFELMPPMPPNTLI